jgi:Golgi nucleoside diphosphatase
MKIKAVKQVNRMKTALLLVLYIGALAASANATALPKSYSAIIDAGSTGTRLSVYEYIGDKLSTQATFVNSPGLASLKEDREITDLLHELLLQAADLFPKIKEIPLGFYGTAGFRSLEKEQSERILRLIADELRDYNLKEASVLSGAEEGKLALLALVLSMDDSDSSKFLEGRSIGIIDMGGKSVQMSVLKDRSLSSQSINVGMLMSETEDKSSGCLAPDEQSQRECAGGLIRKLQDVEAQPLLNAVDDLYLLSFFHDEFGKLTASKTTNMGKIKDGFYKECEYLREKTCRSIFFLVLFIKNIGVRDDKMVHLVSTNNGINITWASGKGFELNLKHNLNQPN